jgi:hypothetical protein
VGETCARLTAIGKMLDSLLDAVREGLAAHREYEEDIARARRLG